MRSNNLIILKKNEATGKTQESLICKIYSHSPSAHFVAATTSAANYIRRMRIHSDTDIFTQTDRQYRPFFHTKNVIFIPICFFIHVSRISKYTRIYSHTYPCLIIFDVCCCCCCLESICRFTPPDNSDVRILFFFLEILCLVLVRHQRIGMKIEDETTMDHLGLKKGFKHMQQNAQHSSYYAHGRRLPHNCFKSTFFVVVGSSPEKVVHRTFLVSSWIFYSDTFHRLMLYRISILYEFVCGTR